jgi:uncharacterized protein
LRHLSYPLDPGEAEAIIVTIELKGELVLVDEKRGRHIAIDRGLSVTGLLGVVAEAKTVALLPTVSPCWMT